MGQLLLSKSDRQGSLQLKTRMHFSRMRTGRSLTVSWSLLPGGRGVSASRGGLLPGGVCSQGGLPPVGLSAPGRGVCSRGCLPPGVSASGGCLLPGVCVCLWGGLLLGGCLLLGGVHSWGVVSQHALRQTPPPVNRMTNRCKNITLATTSLRPVIMNHLP